MLHVYKRVLNTAAAVANQTISGGLNYLESCLYRMTSNGVAGTLTQTYGGWSMAFRLNDLPNSSDFTNLYDAYKINKVVLKITPYCIGAENNSSVATTTTAKLHYYVDYDDANGPTASQAGIDVIRQFKNYHCASLNSKPIYVTIVPKIGVAAAAGGVFASYASQKSQWLQIASPSVDHFGFKAIVEQHTAAANTGFFFDFQCEATYYLSCKDPK